jgi:UDP-N-acetyl-D-mannosaminuronic acid dehydrogenase
MDVTEMKTCVVGLGYIGLPTTLMLAAFGADVTGVDKNKTIVESLRNGVVTFEEKGLDALFQEALAKRIVFSDTLIKAGVYIIAVSTPYDPVSKKVDARHVVSAVKDVLKICPEGAILVIESTISPGTIDHCIRPLINKRVHLVHAPERIIPGNMVYELRHNSRTIGADDADVGGLIKELYASFCLGEIVLTDIKTAEMSKVVENTYRDINIAFANELAKICRDGGMNVYEIIRIANLHPRVNILTPGPGVGGHCISVDPWFLVGDYPMEAKLIRAAREINDSMPRFVLDRALDIMKQRGMDDFSRVGLYGLTYKENVDDTRESPTLHLLQEIRKSGLDMPQVYDPYVKTTLTDNQHRSLQAFLDACDFVVIMVGHEQLRKNTQVLNGKAVLDTRNIGGIPYAELM